MDRLFASDEFQAGTQKRLELGGALGFLLWNLSPFWLHLSENPPDAATALSGRTVDLVRPWTQKRYTYAHGACPDRLYVTLSSAFPQEPTTDTGLLQAQGIYAALQYAPPPVVVEEALTGKTLMLGLGSGGSSEPLGLTNGQLSAVISAIQQTINTDLGQGLRRDLSGKIEYVSNGAITTHTFDNLVSQIYVENLGGSDVTVWGDEDPTQSTPGVVIPAGGGGFAIAWATQHLYLTCSSGSNQPVQVQGWY